MKSLAFLVPGRLETPTGGYVYDRRMIAGLRRLGWSVDVHSLDASFPHPTPAALEHAGHVLAALPDGMRVLVDGLAYGAMPELIERAASRLRVAALVHLPLGADVSSDAATRAHLAAAERRALRAATLVIVTGAGTTALLSEYGIPPGTIVLVEPGAVPVEARRSRNNRPSSPLTLLTVATLQPGKGHELLLEALARLRHLEWRLVCAGSLSRDPGTTDRVRTTITRLGLEGRVSLIGEVDEPGLDRCYADADVFVLATLQETFGMAVAEALSHGLPIVSTATGSIPAMVGNDAGLIVPPGDSSALTSALSCVIGDARLRARLAEGAIRARSRLPTWEHACLQMADALERLDHHG